MTKSIKNLHAIDKSYDDELSLQVREKEDFKNQQIKDKYKDLKSKKVQKLITEHIHQVDNVVSKLKMKLPSFVDEHALKSDGYQGLITAAITFDPSKGAFPPYAHLKIRGRIIDGLRENDIRSRTMAEFSKKMERYHQKLMQELQRQPTEQEIANSLGINLEELQKQKVNSISAAVL